MTQPDYRYTTSCALTASPFTIPLRPFDVAFTDIAVLSKGDAPGGLVLSASPNCKKRYHVGLSTRRFQLRDDMLAELAEPRMADYIRKNYGINRIYRQFTDDAHWYPSIE